MQEHFATSINNGVDAALCNPILKLGIYTTECYFLLYSWQKLLETVAGKNAFVCPESLDSNATVSCQFLKVQLGL